MKSNLAKYILLLGDLAAIFFAFRVAYFLRYESGLFTARPDTPLFYDYRYGITFTLGAWVVIFFLHGLERFPFPGDSPLALAQIIKSSAFLIAALMAGMYLARLFYSRLLFSFLAGLVVLFMVLSRLAYRALMKWLRRYEIGLRRVVIVGKSEVAAELAERVQRHLDLHYKLLGFLNPAPGRIPANGDGEPATFVTGASETMAHNLAALEVDELIFAIPIRRDSETLDFIAACQRHGISIKSVPEYYDLHTSQIESSRIDGIPLLELRQTALSPVHRVLKRAMDLALVVVFAPLVLPLAAAVSILLYWGTRHVVKSEVRIGLGGKPFTLYRFDVGVVEDAAQSPNESLYFRFARLLLRYSGSELPQLWNVLKGDMSLVGPRPESPDRVRHYSVWHRRRLQLKPGITGLAQVKGLRGADSSDLKTKYDLEYAANYSLVVDLALVLATTNTLMARRRLPSHSSAAILASETGQSIGLP
jgi:lipopolysaccharide/colanic/teichoic acid biosynthesis glycosyltransferase